MKHRVISRHGSYVPQYRRWFFWKDFQAACLDAGGSWLESVMYPTEREARKHIEQYGTKPAVPVLFRG